MHNSVSIRLALLLVLVCCCSARAAQPFPPLYDSKSPFITAIRDSACEALSQRITGITVPHHLLAADLIAQAFGRASGQRYSRVVILSPDHFRRSTTPFAVTHRNFRTVLGAVNTDQTAIRALLRNPLVSESGLFSHEHGVRALLPFVAHYFPDSKVVPIVLRIDSKPEQWNALAKTLAGILTSDTLVVQSTDFSHFLNREEACRRDQQALRVLSGGDHDLVKALNQPEHLDSRAAQYLQLHLQSQVFGARAMVIASRNSQDYVKKPLSKTTSYVVQLYSPDRLGRDGAQHYVFAGDTFFGRYVARMLADNETRERVVGEIRHATGGMKLIVNLEGVVMKKCPANLDPYKLCMDKDLTVSLLRDLNVSAVSLANNHTKDFGYCSYQVMKQLLSDAGITVLERGSITDFGPFRLAVFTDVDNSQERKCGILEKKDLRILETVSHDKPLFAFLHWGREYSGQMGLREEQLTKSLQDRGVELIIGCHSHKASNLDCDLDTCRFFSLGNFIFDQKGPTVSGKILEISFFPQGTYFLRPMKIENFYYRKSAPK